MAFSVMSAAIAAVEEGTAVTEEEGDDFVG